MDWMLTRSDQQAGVTSSKKKKGDIPLSLSMLHKMECKACPLDKLHNKNPHMKPTGASSPVVYILGEAPGADEDESGQQFIGKSGQLLRDNIPRDFRDKIRFNNVVRTRPLKNKTPEHIEIECCRPSIIRDIEETKPKAIFGFGRIPLKWAIEQDSISAWRGRRFPIRIGSHVCWYFPMYHPSYVLRTMNSKGSDGKDGKEIKWIFDRDLKNGFNCVEDLPQAEVVEPSELFEGVEIYQGLPEEVAKVLRAIEYFKKVSKYSFDYETNRVRPYNKSARILTVAISDYVRTVAFPVEDPRAQWGSSGYNAVMLALWELFNTDNEKVAHNAKMECEWTAVRVNKDVLRSKKWHCTQVESYVLDERVGAQSLDSVCVIELGLKLKSQSKSRMLGGTQQINAASLETEKLPKILNYNALDAKYTFPVHIFQREKIEALGLTDVVELHRKRITTLVNAQIPGVLVDQKEVKVQGASLVDQIKKVNDEIQALPVIEAFRRVHGVFSPSSPHDMMIMLRDVLKCPEGRRGDKYSTDEKVLVQLKEKVPVAALVLKLRGLEKGVSTYIDPLILGGKEAVVCDDGRLHTSFNQTFTETGRLSSDDPNLQNFPKRKNASIRRVVIAESGHTIIASDYGQIEARVIGMASKDKRLCDAFWTDFDIHQHYSEDLVSRVPEVLTRFGTMKKVRDAVKNKIVFPFFYGSLYYAVARSLEIKESVAEAISIKFWNEYTGVKSWQNSVVAGYERDGFVSCLSGRRRHGPLSRNQLINSVSQGSASDIVVDAMDRLFDQGLEQDKPWLGARLNIHDDLTFVVPDEKVDEAIEDIVLGMVNVPFRWVNVPIQIEVSVGKNWYEMKEVGKFQSHKL